MRDYEDYDGVELAALVARGEVKPAELVEAAISRAEARDPQLGAVVLPRYERARREAEAELPDGPFRGVPFLLKDLHCLVEGERTTFGCRLFEDYVPDHDSELVRRYRAAGLVSLGKTHSPEFGLATTAESRLFGVTHNPWKAGLSPGGSSGGSAAAVAAGIVPVANASDGGGSIRVPAACCGIFGLKPTRARTPVGPDQGEGWSGMSVIHAVSRSVRDSAALLDATEGPERGAPYRAPPPERPFRDEVGVEPGCLRIALQRSAWNGAEVDPECVAAAEEAAGLCGTLGHEVEEAELALDAEALREATATIVTANLRATLEDRAAALGRPLAQDDVEPVTWLMAQTASGKGSVDYARAVRTIHALGRRLEGFLAHFDLVLSPAMATPPFPHGLLSLSNPDPQAYLEQLGRTTAFSQLWNAAGGPAMSVPLHWSEAGLPIGVQFGGRFGDEATLLRLAGQLEAERPWWDRRPPRPAGG